MARIRGVRALRVLVDLGFAPVAAGVIARRRRVMGLLERGQADTRALTRMRRLRDEFDRGPVELDLGVRRVVVVTDPDDVGRVLAESPGPFHPANKEKLAALRQFQPHGVLISRGPVRERRRAVNEAALDTGSELHRLAEPFARVIAEEADDLIESALRDRYIDAARFTTAWFRIARRVTLGDAARDDHHITDDLWRLRSAANWSFAAPPHRRRRDRFIEQLYRYCDNPQPDSLAGAVVAASTDAAVDPIGQIPQWLFAFDAAGIALTRALALLATHPTELDRARSESVAPQSIQPRPYLRACMLESIRLWPTTPTILRDTTEPVTWRDDAPITQPGTAVLIAAPVFHRDAELLPFADAFTPDIWVDGRAQSYPQLVPFSAGPAECPGRNLVLFTTSTLLAHLIEGVEFQLTGGSRLTPDKPLPMTLNNYGLEFVCRTETFVVPEFDRAVGLTPRADDLLGTVE